MSRFDFNQSPFDTLTQHERDQLEKSVDIEFFAEKSCIIGPQSPVNELYVVIKGMVCELADEETVAVYQANDAFDAKALMTGFTAHHFIVHEEALVFTLPKAVVLSLTESNKRFGAYFYSSIAQKFSTQATQEGNPELQTLMTATIRDVGTREPVIVAGSITIKEAAGVMKTRKVKSLLVQHDEQMGITTTTDFRDVIVADIPTHTPLSDLCEFRLLTVDIDEYLFNALLIMTKSNIRRLVVTEQGKPKGILAQVDILSYFSNHSHLIAQKLEQATSLEHLADIARQITRLVQILSGHGVKPPQLGKLVQTLNARLFERAWQLIAPRELIERSCLIVMGSEGRGEQILKTDQDNALIVEDEINPAELAELCERFSSTLSSFGYPPCPGGIMVNHAEWRFTPTSLKQQLHQWIHSGTTAHLMNLAIFMDAEAVAGNKSLLEQAKQFINNSLKDDASFYSRFAKAIEQFDTPLGLFSHLLTKESNGKATLDLKKGGIFPIVHGVRSLSLEYGVRENNTFERIQALHTHSHLDREMADDLTQALTFFMGIKLKTGLQYLSREKRPDNQIEPSTLSTQERDLLKDALSIVKRFKSQLRHHFRLGSF